MNLAYILIGLPILIFGGNWLLKAAVSFSLRLNISKVVIGLTVVSFATSAPELVVSVNAALDGSPGLSLGNVIGSNIANLGLVLSVTILLGAIDVDRSFPKLDWPVMMLASILLYVFLIGDGVLVFYEGFIFLFLLALFLLYLLRFKKGAVDLDEVPEGEVLPPLYKDILYLVLGGVALWGGSELLVTGASGIAESMGISKTTVGLTVVAFGTSIPELAASIIAVINKEKAISLGNLIGSNIFNIFAVLGITSMITPVAVPELSPTILTRDIYWMLGIAFLVLPLIFIFKKFKLGRLEGLILLLGYAFYTYLVISSAV